MLRETMRDLTLLITESSPNFSHESVSPTSAADKPVTSAKTPFSHATVRAPPSGVIAALAAAFATSASFTTVAVAASAFAAASPSGGRSLSPRPRSTITCATAPAARSAASPAARPASLSSGYRPHCVSMRASTRASIAMPPSRQ